MAQVGIFVGTVYGHSLLVAEESEKILKGQDHEVQLFEDGALNDWILYRRHYVLVITSTTGKGDIPDSIAPLFYGIREKKSYQRDLRYGLIALGDRKYDNFCAAGREFDALLKVQGAIQIGETLEIDASYYPEPLVISCPWINKWGQLL